MEPETRKRIGIGAGIFLICAAGVMAGVGVKKTADRRNRREYPAGSDAQTE